MALDLRSFVDMFPERRVRTEETLELTPTLAPFLLQTEEYIVDLFEQRLQTRLVPEIIQSRVEPRFGLMRWSLMKARDFPLYCAVTAIARTSRPRTKGLIRTMRLHPELRLGDALRKHRFFHHKTPPFVRRVEYKIPWTDIFRMDGGVTRVWERAYAIVSRTGQRVAGVTEVFHPHIEEYLASHPGPEVHPLPTPDRIGE